METDERRETQNETLATKLNLTRSWSVQGHRDDLRRIVFPVYFCDSIFPVVYNEKKTTAKKTKIGFISDLALIQRFTMPILRPPEVITASLQWVKVTRGDPKHLCGAAPSEGGLQPRWRPFSWVEDWDAENKGGLGAHLSAGSWRRAKGRDGVYFLSLRYPEVLISFG